MVLRFQIFLKGTKQSMNFFTSIAKGLPEVKDKGGKNIAKSIAVSAIRRAPVGTGDLQGSIKYRRGPQLGYWRVYVGSPVYNKPRGRIYPLVQDRGYARHWIHTSMIDERIRSKYQVGGEDRFIAVESFSPYMTPALREIQGRSSKMIIKELKQLFENAAKRSHIYMK